MKHFKFLAMNLTLAAGFGLLASCGDDPDSPTPLENEIGMLKSGTSADKDLPNGYRIVSVGDSRHEQVYFEAEYDKDGKLLTITDGYSYYDVTSNPFTISCAESYDDERYEEQYTLYLNKSGYISKIEGIYTEEDEDEIEHYTSTLNLSYNEDGQLASLNCFASGYEMEDGEKIDVTYKDDYSLTYASKRLTKVANNWEEKDDHFDKGSVTFTYEYDENYKNVFYQYTYGLSCWMEMDFADSFLAYLGLMGKASSKLPASMSCKGYSYCSKYDEQDDCGYSENFGPYLYNAYGAIKSADGYAYNYRAIPATRGAEAQTQIMRKDGARGNITKGLRGMMFKRLHKKHNTAK